MHERTVAANTAVAKATAVVQECLAAGQATAAAMVVDLAAAAPASTRLCCRRTGLPPERPRARNCRTAHPRCCLGTVHLSTQ